MVAAGITGGASLLGAGISAFGADKASGRANALGRENLEFQKRTFEASQRAAKARDLLNSRARTENNQTIRRRQRIGERVSKRLFEASGDTSVVQDLINTTGSTLEGELGGGRRSIRSAFGGSLNKSRNEALNLQGAKIKTQLTNKLIMDDITRRENLGVAATNINIPLIQGAAPLTPSIGGGGVSNALLGAQNSASAEANAYSSLAGQFGSFAGKTFSDALAEKFKTPAAGKTPVGILPENTGFPVPKMAEVPSGVVG